MALIIFQGYVCLFLLSCYLGKLFHAKKKVKPIAILLIVSTSLWFLFIKFCNVILPSRPLANLTYVLWGLANGSLHVFIMTLADFIYPEQFRFMIFAEMISEYRLSIFIIANILSTIVRRIFDTKSMSILYTIKVNHLYLSTACSFVAIVFYGKFIRSNLEKTIK